MATPRNRLSALASVSAKVSQNVVMPRAPIFAALRRSCLFIGSIPRLLDARDMASQHAKPARGSKAAGERAEPKAPAGVHDIEQNKNNSQWAELWQPWRHAQHVRPLRGALR